MSVYKEVLEFLHNKSSAVKGWRKRFRVRIILADDNPYIFLYPPSNDAIREESARTQELDKLNQELAANGLNLQFITCELGVQSETIKLFVQETP